MSTSSNLTIGDEYILCYESNAMGALSGKYHSRVDNGVSLLNDVATIKSADVLSFKIVSGTTSGKYAFKFADGNYLKCTSTSNNNLASSETLVVQCNLDISINAQKEAVIKCNGATTSNPNQLQYNSNSGQERFSNYKTATQKQCKLYRKKGGGEPSVETVATPAIEPNGGEVEADSKILVNCDTEGASIVYKWSDGEEVNTGENIVEIDAQAGTLSVWAVKDGMNNSSIVTAKFTIKGDTPVTMLEWTLDGTYNKETSTSTVVLGLTNESAKGTWVASKISNDQYVSKAYGGVQIGKKDQPFTGTFDLSDSAIPATAIIRTAKMNVRYASGATSYVWRLEVNGVKSDSSIEVDGQTAGTLVIENVNLKGNQIRFVSTESANGIIVKGFAIEYVVAPERPVLAEDENDGDKIVITGAEGTTIHWRTVEGAAAAPAKGAADLTGWNKNENTETPHVLTLSKDTHNLKGKAIEYMAVSASGLQSDKGMFVVAADGVVTGIEGIEAEAAEAEVEWFNLQGVRVANPEAGLYIRRQGNKVEKVIVK